MKTKQKRTKSVRPSVKVGDKTRIPESVLEFLAWPPDRVSRVDSIILTFQSKGVWKDMLDDPWMLSLGFREIMIDGVKSRVTMNKLSEIATRYLA